MLACRHLYWYFINLSNINPNACLRGDPDADAGVGPMQAGVSRRGWPVLVLAGRERRMTAIEQIPIEQIPTEKILADRNESMLDILICKFALLQGVTEYSGGSVRHRLNIHRAIVAAIDAELFRRDNER